MWPTDAEKTLLEANEWVVECESPFEIRHPDGSFATGSAAHAVIEQLQNEEAAMPRMLPIIPDKCLVCGSPWKGGCEVPGNRYPKIGLRVFYDCGASMSVDASENDCYFLRLKNCHSEYGVWHDNGSKRA